MKIFVFFVIIFSFKTIFGSENPKVDKIRLINWLIFPNGKTCELSLGTPIFSARTSKIYWCDTKIGCIGQINENMVSEKTLNTTEAEEIETLEMINANLKNSEIIQTHVPIFRQARNFLVTDRNIWLISVVSFNNFWFRLIQKLSFDGKINQTWAEKCGPNFEPRLRQAFAVENDKVSLIDTYSALGLITFDFEEKKFGRIVFKEMKESSQADNEKTNKLAEMEKIGLGKSELELLSKIRDKNFENKTIIKNPIPYFQKKIPWDSSEISVIAIIKGMVFLAGNDRENNGQILFLKNSEFFRSFRMAKKFVFSACEIGILVYDTLNDSLCIFDFDMVEISKIRAPFSEWKNFFCSFSPNRVSFHDERNNYLYLFRVER